MKSKILKSLILAGIVMLSITAQAQRIVKGTVYLKGEPAAGIIVETTEGSFVISDFEGKFQIETNSKWIMFNYNEETKKIKLDKNSNNHIDFYFDGIKSANNSSNDDELNLKSLEELKKEQNLDFIKEWSSFYEFQKNGYYLLALPHWEIIYNNFPKASKNIYIFGVEFYKDFLDKAQSSEEKEKNLNKIMEIYDQRIKYFQEKEYVLGRKGLLWLEYYMNDSDVSEEDRVEAMKTGYEWLSEAIELRNDKTEIPILVTTMNISSQLFQYGKLPKETVVRNYYDYNKILKTKLDANNADVDKINEGLEYIEKFLLLSGAANCEDLIRIYTPQFEKNSGDIDFIKEMLQILEKAKCDESDLYNIATEKLYELDQSPEAAFNLARRFLKLEDYTKAKEYYEEAIEQESDQELLATYYFEYGLFIFAKENALQKARDLQKKALALNPNYCEALMLIGDIYVAGSSDFSSDEFKKASIFWLAVDYYNQAAKVSDDCYEEASQKAADYQKYFPAKEEVFFQGLEEGDSYKVEGWINETTSVRF
ncbi:MAG: tetratricopeptide repeat protein [Prolixibacteraceae bacterium]|nr:tetratricopeptide repeat protein [Prolixibacteraceae bacterium]